MMSLKDTAPLLPSLKDPFTDDELIRHLVDRKKLNDNEVDRLRGLHSTQNGSLPVFLVRSGLVSDLEMAKTNAEIHRLSLLDEADTPDLPLYEVELSPKFLSNALALPVSDDETITLAMADPGDTFSIQAVAMACGKPVTVKVATIALIERAIEKLYNNGQSAMANLGDAIDTHDITEPDDSIERLRDLAAEAPIIRLVNLIINKAIDMRASDIHIEPFEHQLKVRYRVDGVLQEVEAPPARSVPAVISRIKIMAKLNIAERRLPQDGRIQLRVQGKTIDLRVSTVPTLHGESVVLRILDKGHVELDLGQLGFSDGAHERLNTLLSLPHGIVLVTGPTGSGKTTTLYAALQKLNRPDKKILTVEDPVEYQLEGINQIQVKPKIGLNFADALRSIVRQDPDIIMIGEMRDLETAKIAIQSALTGHLVFSTLHTNDAGGSVTRLLDMGTEDYLLTSTLNGILAQRLVRRLCEACKGSFVPPDELIEELGLNRLGDTGRSIELCKATGCPACAHTGYRGRSIITEVLILSEAIRRQILAHEDGSHIQQTAIGEGMDTMQTDGLRKALAGETTIDEVMRVTQG